MEDMLRVGVITSTHGIRGDVKVFPTTDDSRRFDSLSHVYVESGTGMTRLDIQRVKYFKNMVILKFKGYETIEEIENYKGTDLMITRDQAVKLEPDEYFITDLIGLRVDTEEGKTLGTLTDVMQTGANDVYVVETPDGGEVLLPAIRQCVLEIRPEEGFISVHILDGLLD